MKRWHIITEDDIIECSFVGVDLKRFILWLVCRGLQVKICGFSTEDYYKALHGTDECICYAIGKRENRKIAIIYKDIATVRMKVKDKAKIAMVQQRVGYRQNVKAAKRRWDK